MITRKSLFVILLALIIISIPSSATIVGIEWNQSNSSSSAIRYIDTVGNTITPPDFNRTLPWSGMRRINISQTQYQTMTTIPKFWYNSSNTTDSYGNHYMRWWVSDRNVTGFKVHPAFISNYVEMPSTLIGSFEGAATNTTPGYNTSGYNFGDFAGVNFTATTGDKLSSVPGVKPMGGQNNSGASINGYRIIANNRGTGWGLQTFQQVSAAELLYAIEYANWNIQSVISAGITQISDDGLTNMALPTGLTAGIGANSTNLYNASGQTTTVHYQTGQITRPMSYRSIENIYGNIWKWEDGINIKSDNKPWTADHGFASDMFSYPYLDSGFTLPTSNGYTSNIIYSSVSDWFFLPSAVAGSSSTYLTDYYIQSTGNKAAIFGGGWGSGANAGIYTWFLNHASTESLRDVGARIAYLPNGSALTDANFTFTPSTAGFIPNNTGGVGWSFPVSFTNIATGSSLQYNYWTITNTTPGNNTQLLVSTAVSPTITFPIGNWSVNYTVSGTYDNSSAFGWVNVTYPYATANFTANQTLAYQYPMPVTFTDYSIVPYNWSWQFGDTYISTQQNPTHIYTVAGNYSVNLTVYNSSYSLFGSSTQTISLMADSDTYLRSWLQFENATVIDLMGTAWTNSGGVLNSPGRFLNQSLYLSGNNYITSPSSTIWDRSPYAGELEMWVNVSAYGDAGKTFFRRSSGTTGTTNGWGFFNINGTRYGNAFYYGSGSNYTTPFDIPLNTWTHVALVRATDQYWRVYVNGQLWGTPVYMGGLNVDTNNPVYLGSSGPGTEHTFRVDEFRFSQGVPRFVSNFSTPVAAYRGSLTGGIDPNPNSTVRYKINPEDYALAVIYNQTYGGTRNRSAQIQNVTYAKAVRGAMTFNASHEYGIALRPNLTTYSDLVLESSSIDNVNGVASFNVTRSSGGNIVSLFDNRTSLVDIQLLYTVYSDVPTDYQYFAYGDILDGGWYPIHNFIQTNMTYGMWGTPVTNFAANTTTPNIYSAVQFTDSSTNYPDSYIWDFGDGTSSTLKNPTHSYTSLGTYTVSLTSYLAANTSITNSTTKTGYITVISAAGAPVAGFTATPLNTTVSAPVTFTDTSTGTPTSWAWDFGDSSTSVLQNPIHSYGATGLYTVNLTVANVNGTSTLSKAAYINISTSPYVANTTTSVDISMSPAYTLTLTVTDAKTGLNIPNASVIDYVTNVTYFTNTVGVATLSEPYGSAAGAVYATGYNPKGWSYVMDSNKADTIQLVPATTSSDVTHINVAPQYVTFHVRAGWGVPIVGATVQAQGISTSTGSWDWVSTIIGVPLTTVALNTTLMTQTTDSYGNVQFYMIPTGKYNVGAVMTGYTFQNLTVVPAQTDYTIYSNNATPSSLVYTGGSNQLVTVNISVTQVYINATAASLNISYVDANAHTTGGNVYVYQKNQTPFGRDTLLATWPVSNSFTNSTVVIHTIQQSGYVQVNVTQSDFGRITRSYPWTMNSVPISFIGLDPNLAMLVAFGIMILTTMLGSAASARQALVASCIEGYIFYAMHWFQPLIDRGIVDSQGYLIVVALTIMAVIAFFGNVEIRKKKER